MNELKQINKNDINKEKENNKKKKLDIALKKTIQKYNKTLKELAK